MAITISCAKCGSENPLGRVFCEKCGKKLESGDISQKSIAKKKRPKKALRLMRTIIAIVSVLVALAVVACLFWQQPIAADKGTRRAGSAADGKLKLINQQLTTGGLRLIKQEFSEKEVNGYLLFHRRDKKEMVEVALRDGTFSARAVRAIGPLTIGSFSAPTLFFSRNLRGTFRDDRIVITHASVGHLPMLGPFKGPVHKAVRAAALRACQHAKLLGQVQKVELNEDAVTLTIGLPQ